MWGLALKQSMCNKSPEKIVRMQMSSLLQETAGPRLRGVAWVAAFLLSASPNQVTWEPHFEKCWGSGPRHLGLGSGSSRNRADERGTACKHADTVAGIG